MEGSPCLGALVPSWTSVEVSSGGLRQCLGPDKMLATEGLRPGASETQLHGGARTPRGWSGCWGTWPGVWFVPDRAGHLLLSCLASTPFSASLLSKALSTL
jgi:hypothetical protein